MNDLVGQAVGHDVCFEVVDDTQDVPPNTRFVDEVEQGPQLPRPLQIPE